MNAPEDEAGRRTCMCVDVIIITATVIAAVTIILVVMVSYLCLNCDQLDSAGAIVASAARRRPPRKVKRPARGGRVATGAASLRLGHSPVTAGGPDALGTDTTTAAAPWPSHRARWQ